MKKVLIILMAFFSTYSLIQAQTYQIDNNSSCDYNLNVVVFHSAQHCPATGGYTVYTPTIINGQNWSIQLNGTDWVARIDVTDNYCNLYTLNICNSGSIVIDDCLSCANPGPTLSASFTGGGLIQ